jgi:outer membrane lipoprotein-sorting protein
MSAPALIRNNLARALLLVALFVSSAGAQEVQLSVDEIVQKHVIALGGADKLSAIQNVTMTGTASLMCRQLQAPVTVRAKRPMSMRMDTSVQGQTFVQAFDGNMAWMINLFMGSPEPNKSSEEDTQNARDDADFIAGSLVD